MKLRLHICLLVPFAFIFTLLAYYSTWGTNETNQYKYYKHFILEKFKKFNGYCYDDVVSDEELYIPFLEEILEDTLIFFIESRCHNATEAALSGRESCAVESAAYMNPNATVYVLFPTPVMLSATQAPYIRSLLARPNVKLRRISLADYTRDTPLELWYRQGTLRTSKFLPAHTSDVMRLLTLWKFGGIYLDLDTVTLKPLADLVPFIAIANDNFLGNAVIGSHLTGIGHITLSSAIQEIRDNFRGDQWGSNGPALVTSVLRSVCGLGKNDSIHIMDAERCQGFNVYPAKYFHPLPYYEWERYFTHDPTQASDTLAALNDSYTVHIWNKMSSDTRVVVGSNQPYSQLARIFCPVVYGNVGAEF